MDSGPGTRLIALLGDPVAHSLSPRFQNAAIRHAGLDAVYLALRCRAADFPALLRGLAGAGAAGNVTIPHKSAAVALLDQATAAVERTGACNTFWTADGRLHGDNTDVEGFGAACRELVGAPAGARVLVLGAGGAARAAVAALLDARADAVHVLNRSPERAGALAAALDPRGRKVTVLPPGAALRREGYDLVVNATPLGLLADDPLPLDLAVPARVGAALDLVYRPGGTRWTAEAARLDIPGADGTEMLLHQGAAAFRRWFDTPAPMEVMRGALGRVGV
ncbi:MAG TPA: shikimate dehydrogenase [Longimicrobiales bacterium]|nr:shikimate dehydrogenase [Longimicrobiales bacterium]